MSKLSPRSKRLRRRILEATRRLPAAHIAPAFSALEIVDAVYEKMRPGDAFVMSKGHGYLAQLAVMEERKLVPRSALDDFCTAKPGAYGAHPDLGLSGIEASTGSLGHGLGMAVGMALADRSRRVYVVASDGELMEGSTWEAALAAANLGLANLTLLVDNNDFVSATRIRDAFPAFYPIAPKFKAFGWDCENANGGELGHLLGWEFKRPVAFVCATVKGAGVSFMEGRGVWHYRGLSDDEYALAMEELS